jgi:hypothetical protein
MRGNTEVAMIYFNALGLSHDNNKSHHGDRRHDEKSQKRLSQPIGDGMQKPRWDAP